MNIFLTIFEKMTYIISTKKVKEVFIVVNAIHISNNILTRAFEENVKITPMKLQKLLYFVYKKYLKETSKPLFSERFQAWRYGPVVDSVYQTFKDYGSKEIDDYATNELGEVWSADIAKNEALKTALDYVWAKYSDFSGIELSTITHKVDSAWYKTLQRKETILNDDDILGENWWLS